MKKLGRPKKPESEKVTAEQTRQRRREWMRKDRIKKEQERRRIAGSVKESVQQMNIIESYKQDLLLGRQYYNGQQARSSVRRAKTFAIK